VTPTNAAGCETGPITELDDDGYVTGAVLPVDGGTSASTGQPHG
jgi:hypothetical protein